MWTIISGPPHTAVVKCDIRLVEAQTPEENLSLDCFINRIRTGTAILAYLGAM
jgi:hypothetical protein